MSIQMGIQLSSVTPYLDTPARIRRTFARLAKIGYQNVQLQGIPAKIPDAEIAQALKEAGLHCVATQEDFPMGFGDNPDPAIARAVSCGARYLCCALIPREVTSVDRLDSFAEGLCTIAERVQQAGLRFSFHPIAPDFRKMEGIPVYERLLSKLPKSVQLTFCVNAALSADVNPLPVFQRYRGRMDLVHFKDDVLLPDGTRQLMPLGQGSHDWRPLLADCAASDVKFIFAEQERWRTDAFDCAQTSYQYLKRIGL